MATLTLDVFVSGGEKLQAHVDGIQGQLYLESLIRNYRNEYRTQVLPALAHRTPRRSGKLSKSFRTANTRRGDGFTLTSTAPYVNYVQFREPKRVGAKNVHGLADVVYRPKANDLGRRAGALALREVTQ